PLISQDAKDSADDAGKKAPEVDAGEASDNGGHDNQVSRSEDGSLFQQDRQTEYNNSTDDINTVSSPVSTAGPSFVNAASQIPLNAAGPSASTNAFEEHSFERFSPFKNAISLPHVHMVTPIDDTRIFSNAYDDDVEAIKEELLRFKLLKVWTLVDLPKDKWEIGTKWVYRNKKDERGTVIKNKARLVAQGHTQEEASTLMESNKPLIKDEEAEDVDVHLYKSMIGLLMYLTASRHDITFVMCACARFQVTPKNLHLHVVKRIFRYLKGQPKLGLWYPKDSLFDLETYSDSDSARASLDKKSTTRGC
nr:putative ribonuclease H-like domain-containing protein [Tanacetum cinerariifolium]